MELARFTQVRPIQAGNSFELVKSHFRLDIPDEEAGFLENVGRSTMAELREHAMRHLREGAAIQRANDCLAFLSGQETDRNLDEMLAIEVPHLSVMQYAYRICFAFPELLNEQGSVHPEFDGSDIHHESSADAAFPDIFRVDLFALYLQPGLLTEYRTWLSMLFRVTETLNDGTNIQNMWAALNEKGERRPNDQTSAYRAVRKFLNGRILIPPAIRADKPPEVQSTPLAETNVNPLHSGNSIGQLAGQLSTEPAPRRDYVLPKVPHMRVPMGRPGSEFPELSKPVQEIPKPIEVAPVKKKDIDPTRGEIK